MGFWPVVLNVLKNSDVVLLVVDARMPEISRNTEIVSKVEMMKGKRIFVVFNKIDLISGKMLRDLKKDNPNGFFVSSVKRIGVSGLKKSLINMAENWERDSLRVGIVGYPNVGKSSLINLLVPSANARVKDISGTTKKTQWVRSGRLRIMDSPGVIPFGDKKVRVGMTASKNPHKIRNPERIALSLLSAIQGTEDGRRRMGTGVAVRKFYGVSEDLDDYDAFLEIGKKKGFLVKGGEVDENRTAIRIIEDWQKGKIRLGF